MIWLGLAAVIVLAAAAILLWIIAEAIGIKRHALRALAAGKLVETRTKSLGAIIDVNNGLRGAVGLVVSIHARAKGLEDALVATEARP